MGSWGTAFNVISLVYAGVAVLTLVRLLRRGRAVFGAPLRPDDARLLSAAAFYLLTPLAVALHEMGHAVLVYALGGRIVDVHFLLYWGYVVPDRSFGPYGDLAVALAGNLVTLALGLGAAWLELRRPSKAAVNLIFARLAEIQLSMVLVFYPIMCLIGFGGDFLLIYRPETWPVSLPLLLAHLGFLCWLIWARRTDLYPRFRLHGSPLWDEIRKDELALSTDPGDARAALRAAWAYLQAGLPTTALPLARRALDLGPSSPAAKVILGQALAATGDAAADALLSEAVEEQGLDPLLAAHGRIALARYLVDKGDSLRAARAASLALEALPSESDAVEVLGQAVRDGAPPTDALAALDRAASKGNLAARGELEELQRLRLRGLLTP
jgi:tetratricopeptide (TPR) repeat protein